MITPTYEPGTWYAVIADGAVALLPPTLTEETVHEVWLALRENPDPTHGLTALVQGNLVDLPPFAIVAIADGAMRGFVHGDVGLRTTTAEGTSTHSGAEAMIWAEIVVPDVESVTLSIPAEPTTAQDDAPRVGALAAITAVVLASRVDLCVVDVEKGVEDDAPGVRSPGRPAGLGVEGSRRRVARRLADPSPDDASSPHPVGAKLGSLTVQVPGLLSASAVPSLADVAALAEEVKDSLTVQETREEEQAEACAEDAEPAGQAAGPSTPEPDAAMPEPEADAAVPEADAVARETGDAASDQELSNAVEDAVLEAVAAAPSLGEGQDGTPEVAPGAATVPLTAPHVPGIISADVVPEVGAAGPVPLPPLAAVVESSVPKPSAAPTQVLPQQAGVAPTQILPQPAAAGHPVPKPGPPKPSAAPTQVLAQPVPHDVELSDDDVHGATVLSAELVEIRRQLKNRKQGPLPGPIAVAPVPPRVPSIHMSSGEIVSLDRPVLIGRAPSAARISARDRPHLVTVESRTRDISRTHAEVRCDGEEVLVTDLNSTNGLMLTEPGQPPRRLHAGEPTPLPLDAVVDLGDGITFTLERV